MMSIEHNETDDHQSALHDFIYRTAAEGILQADATGRCSGMNPAAASMLQVSVDQIIGKSPRQVFGNNINLIRLLRQGGPEVLEITLAKGRIARGIGHDLPDKSRVVILHDITEQYQLDSRREALIKAISHDLRNPISALNGYAELVAKFGELNDHQQRFVMRIQQTATKLWDVITNLVDLSWIEAGMPLLYIPIEMSSLIHKAVNELMTEARRQNIKIVISTQDPIPTIMGDPERIKQAIYHLVDNAIQYSEPQSNVVVHAWQQGNLVFCSIADRGLGIAEHEIDQIWDRLWRSANERVRNIPGGGVGLTYVRTIIKRHGGDISVESTPGEGTTFTFVLPLATEEY
jgi:two-component system phosphate regulon sensor histidine kinase PhoR